MSEQMFGIKVNGGIVDAAPSADEAIDKAIIFYSRHIQHPWQIVPVRIVEDAEPCPWELSQFGDSQPYKNEKDWISFISQYGWRWCPMCGRRLEEP